MTQEEIIAMARHAGMEQDGDMWFSNLYKTDMDVHISHLEAFAKLVAAKALAQLEQEPVGDDWTPCMKLPVVVYVRKQRLGESHVSTREGITPVKPDDLIMRGVSGEEYPIGRAIFEQTYSLNTTPPQRTWVGLTDVEIDYLLVSTAGENEETHISFARAIEAKLKEKNT